MDIQETLYNSYIEELGEGLMEVAERKPAKIGQVRLFLSEPPEWILIAEDLGRDLFIAIPLTSYIQLAITDRYPPVIRWRGINLVPLPFWIYINKDILEKFSEPAFNIKNLEKIKDYVKKARTKGIGKWREKFIKTVAERFKYINTLSVLKDVEEAEREELIHKIIRIELTAQVLKWLAPYAEQRYAAKQKQALRGKNWLGIVEEGKLLIYVPKDFVGREIKVSIKGEEIYRGPAGKKIIIENLPNLSSYEILERELNVELFNDK